LSIVEIINDNEMKYCYNDKYNLQITLYLEIIFIVMTKKKIVILPKTRKVISEMGDNIRLARLRRKLSAEQVAERANISRPTLSAIEKGSPTVSIGSYLMVLQVLGLEKDFLLVAKDDELGRKLQDAEINTRNRSPKRMNR
jgi:DNA-binding XRE family transcriptional regulator